MELRELLNNIPHTVLSGSMLSEINGLKTDSRQVTPGNLFIASRGINVDGHAYIPVAEKSGAAAIIFSESPQSFLDGVTYIQVANPGELVGHLADRFYGAPSSKLQVVGITGTNGKTTVATLLYQLFTALGFSCGLISTVRNLIRDQEIPATHTTPDPVSLQGLLAQMASVQCSYVFMEASSHAIHQHRLTGVRFKGAIFTNISHDHLDYHGTFDEYIRVKKSFFDKLPADAFALTNIDDRRGAVMLQNTAAKRYSYSLKSQADFKGRILENNLTGLILHIDQQEVHFRMVGAFNAYNLMAVFAASSILGIDKAKSLSALSNLKGAPGRFETIVSANDRLLAIVDYAHTPDALINVLATIRQIIQTGVQLITVVGCGGDRDKTKRPLMAEAACAHSDQVVFTADNPRSEEVDAILNDMESGLTNVQKRKTLKITDRKEAIRVACKLANPGDVILIAGKGHETYQEVKGVRLPFDDRQVIREMFELLNR